MEANTAKRLERIQSLFDAGKTHGEIAKELGYTDIKSYYRYIYRYDDHLNYKKLFNKKNLSVVPEEEQQTEVIEEKTVDEVTIPKENMSKAESIVSLISRGMDIKDITKKKRFGNTQELANYMKSKGYIWSSSEKNYVLVPQEKQISLETRAPLEIPIQNEVYETMGTDEIRKIMNIDDNKNGFKYLERYALTLKWLEDNMEKLQCLLNVQSTQQGEIPRYILPGMTTNKGIKINQLLESLIKDFSVERNIAQKDIIEVALIKFLRENGYSKEVKAVLKL